MSNLQLDVETLTTGIAAYSQQIQNNRTNAHLHGNSWSDKQWEAHHLTQERLAEQVAYYEEQLHNLG